MALLDAVFLEPQPFEVYFAVRTDGRTGSGRIDDPWDGSTATNFDGKMSTLPTNIPVRVHLGPATSTSPFKTSGFWLRSDGVPGSIPAPGWQARANMAIVGAGVGLTHLQLQPGILWFRPPFSCSCHGFVPGSTRAVEPAIDKIIRSDPSVRRQGCGGHPDRRCAAGGLKHTKRKYSELQAEADDALLTAVM